MKKARVIGIDYIRAMACLSVVLIHTASQVLMNFDLPASTVEIAKLTQMTFIFATPIFVMISEFLLSYSYHNSPPKGFWKKRISFIFIPYITMSIAYGLFYMILNAGDFSYFLRVVENYIIAARWHGYFILIIFQFYLLHFLFNRYIHRFNPYLVTALSLALNIAYLHFFRVASAAGGLLDGIVWVTNTRIFFPGWLIFFVIAYFAGRYITEWMIFLKKAGSAIVILALMSWLFVLYNVIEGHYIVIVSSRVDVLFYTIFVFLGGLYVTSYLKGIPGPIKLISKYSFSIYLLHMMFLVLFTNFVPFDLKASIFAPAAFVFSIAGSITTAYLIKRIPGSAYLIGQVDRKTSIAGNSNRS
ncbi:acyltransferase family protein [Jeotgalibacillus terrae]|uniref:Acyltransferase family protein n=1 Tax=Jeotgalibacillus terrae TaxID=587735 RepID=A0ABW5ZM36_9BACL|nr:acyltransferase family protein [Jeotgalibacillus terrae]MBM7578091.1 membrane-bound acyltransferase YfiQ involved in biofilm formation [Jeotgalibacillus terrae]